jgi:general L-amino acid transport system permease protein
MRQGETPAWVRREEAPLLPPPAGTVGLAGWLRQNLFAGPGGSLLTLALAALLALIGWAIIDWALIRAVWTGADREACAVDGAGACWPFVWAKFPQWIYGFYPIAERWRPALVFVIGAVALAPMLIPSVPFKQWNALFLIVVFPVIALILLSGGNFGFARETYLVLAILCLLSLALVRVFPAGFIAAAALLAITALLDIDFGLEPVETSSWGGLLVTLVVSVTGIAASLPLGILLALGRRSRMPLVRLFSVIFIELWRGVPLITVLFMSSVMLPLFLPDGVTFDKLLRALIGMSLFSAAYMAEVVRGGLQAIGKGQYEGAMALGLSWWQMMRKIVLPQALKISIPNIVGTYIGLFKDTTLVLIIGIYDFLGIITAGTQDAKWASPQTGNTGYFVAALVYFAFCFGMSRYAMYTERRLATGHRR